MNTLTKANWDAKIPIYEIPQNALSKKGITCLLLDVDGKGA